jgi:hypothetical protein
LLQRPIEGRCDGLLIFLNVRILFTCRCFCHYFVVLNFLVSNISPNLKSRREQLLKIILLLKYYAIQTVHKKNGAFCERRHCDWGGELEKSSATFKPTKMRKALTADSKHP